MLDPKERAERGHAIQAEVLARATPAPTSLVQESWRDFVFADVWSRPGLSRRNRYLIAIASAAHGAEPLLEGFVFGALKNRELSVIELREAALHMGPYGGWHCADRIDKAVTKAAQSLGLPIPEAAPLQEAPLAPQVRESQGAEEFLKAMLFPAPQPSLPLHEPIRHFIFGEVWRRRALDEPSRRWLTLVGACAAGIEVPLKAHTHAAIASGNCTPEEMQEFVLQFAVHFGWPQATIVQSVVTESIRRVKAGLPWNG